MYLCTSHINIDIDSKHDESRLIKRIYTFGAQAELGKVRNNHGVENLSPDAISIIFGRLKCMASLSLYSLNQIN